MKAAIVEEWGQSPVYADHPEPVAQAGAAITTVEASALTNLTKGLLSGKHHASSEIQLPAIAGVDGVARLADGTRVYTGPLRPYGMMAERTLVDPTGAVIVPDGVDSVTVRHGRGPAAPRRTGQPAGRRRRVVDRARAVRHPGRTDASPCASRRKGPSFSRNEGPVRLLAGQPKRPEM